MVKLVERKKGETCTHTALGNIANNAFNNAKLLIKAGFECDVLCPDYYHIMGCPEWEDADFEGDIGDHFKPKWYKVDTRDYQRPAWFVQGPKNICLHYLIERNAGNKNKANKIWKQLSKLNGSAPEDTISKLETIQVLTQIEWRRYLDAALSPAILNRYFAQFMGFLVKSIGGRFYRVFKPTGTLAKKFPLVYKNIDRFSNYFSTFCILILRAIFKVISIVHCAISKAITSTIFRKMHLGYAGDRNITEQRNHALTSMFTERFPTRQDQLTAKDMKPYAVDNALWESVFKYYDVIIGYSTDPIRPMLTGSNYFALEHGTLREIPFAADATGRLCALAYNNAAHTFVTNFDCIDNARTLCDDNFTFINHPFDEDHGLTIDGVSRLRETLLEDLDAEFLIFFPTRHDWVPNTGYADKANDKLLEAFVELRQQGVKLGLVCCSWGKNVEQSKDLLAKGNCASYVKWCAPMGVIQFERTASACDITADQFKLGAFGGVTFKAMAVGSPILSYLNPELLEGLYPEPPPIINCLTKEEIKTQILRCTEDAEFLKKCTKCVASLDKKESFRGRHRSCPSRKN